MTTYDAEAMAAFYDAYGEREWTRFEDGRTPLSSIATHTAYLEKFVKAGDRVLDAGCGPGRFTLELARVGARVVAADISPGQLELHRRYTADVEDAVEDRVVADVTQLPFADNEFDVSVCYGGALSYVLERAPDAAAELARVTRPGGRLLVSAMTLVGITVHSFNSGMFANRDYTADVILDVVSTGVLPKSLGSDHPAMKLYRSRELLALLEPHGAIVGASATGLFNQDSDLAHRLELDLGAEPGALDFGNHLIVVLQVA